MAEYTPSEIKRMENQIQSDSEALKSKQARLDSIRKSCQHDWGETVADHIYHKGYHIDGDAPGTMGVDRQLPMDVPAKTEKRWKRVCKKCAKVDYTTRTTEKITETPKF